MPKTNLGAVIPNPTLEDFTLLQITNLKKYSILAPSDSIYCWPTSVKKKNGIPDAFIINVLINFYNVNRSLLRPVRLRIGCPAS